MEDLFSTSILPPAPNLSVPILLGWGFNLTLGQGAPASGPPSRRVRLVFLGIILVVAVAGNTTVLCRLCGRAPAPSALPRAKVQSLKMSLLLALLFVGCELPYFAARLAAAWSSGPAGDWEGEGLSAALRVVGMANSALNPFVYLFFQAGDCQLRRRLRRRLGSLCCAPQGGAEDEEGPRGHQALYRQRWPHPHYHHARREPLDEGGLRPPPPRPRPLPCSCESAF
ncbi:PREDICTED: probable G-protein coupled receptor 150 [Colobus angolensis palliatus]|uniref:probable G-protein coupled receptor 150 n=1 Tax=Colobus angolensis palliatus TaxID=336983 RepID=UPI0005F3DC81|nr:PREDICTED: probable G-protein coupled receptor 150 [Colobus angolensis palliatus]